MATLPTTNPNAAMQTQGLNAGQAPGPVAPPIAGTPFSAAQQIAAQSQNNAAQNAQTPGIIPPTIGAPTINPQTGVQAGVGITSNPTQNANAAFGATNTNPDQNMSLSDKYTLAHQTAQASGQEAPSSQGAAMAGVQSNLPVSPQDQQAQVDQQKQIQNVTNTLSNDPGYQQLLKDQQDYLSSQNQTQSLQQQYDSMMQSSGIPALNTQLLNMKNVMDGTEGDLRNEIQAAGGFATESQVQALANARNKNLIQNYNNLLNTKSDLENQINQSMGFAQQDRANAVALANEKLNFDQQIIKYQQQFTQNAIDGYSNIIKSVGYNGLFHALQPSDISLVEKTLGLPAGGLAGLAQQELNASQPSAQKDALQNQLLQAQIANTQANTAKTRSDIAVSNGSVTTPIQTANGIVNAPSVLSPYIQTAYNGSAYADLSSLSPTDKAKMAQIASQAGIKSILTAGDAGKLNAISVSKTNLTNIQDSLSSLLNDKQTPLAQGIENSIKSFLGNADIKSFNAWRTAVINNVQALAGGAGSGLRINQAEIDTALKNDLPVLTGTGADNLSTALAKIGKLNSQMDVWTQQLLGGGNTASANANASQGGAGYIPPVGTVITSGGKSYHVIDAQGNLQPI